MSKYRHRLPQLADRLFMTDGGMETFLVFHEGVELPAFAAFDLLRRADGLERLRRYYERYVALARVHALGLVLESPTWRANADWGRVLGYDAVALADANRLAIGLLLEIRAALESREVPIVIGGVLGPRGDGYVVERLMSPAEARDYHAEQVGVFAGSDADMVTVYTLNYVDEGIGVALAAREHRMPAAISFTLETDGRLPSGETLEEAVQRVDAASGGHPAYYMINCAHPEHFQPVLRGGGDWVRRIRGLRANASRLSHAELEQCTELDVGDPLELGRSYRELRELLPGLAVVGGCCGTDHRHVGAICAAVA
jgi:S-methylmethionine-dependent homocysteine/selenocysteine methylase